MRRYLLGFFFGLIISVSNAQVSQDTVHPNGKRGRATIQVIPCPCDSNHSDSFVMMPREFDDIQKTVSVCTVFRFNQPVFCLKTVETICWQKSSDDISGSEKKRGILMSNGQRGQFERSILPVICDSLQMIYRCPLVNMKGDINHISRDTFIPFYRYKFCLDTVETIIWQKSILDIADSIAIAIKVPPQLVYEIGLNESKWPNIYDLNYLIHFGDLQVIDKTFHHFYKYLGLKGGKTRINYLIVGIYYLRLNYEQQGSWRKARYTYGRGFWKSPDQWTSLERKFMNRIDWSMYD